MARNEYSGFNRNLVFGGNDYPSLRDMEIFVCVIMAGSFSAAGRRIGMSPASVSRHINMLEDRLGVRLLNRTSRSLSLSNAGEIFFRRAERLLSDAMDIRQEVALENQQAKGTLHVHSRILVGERYIAPSLPLFLADYPDITVDLKLSNEDIDLVENNIDVSIRIGQLAPSSLIAKKLTASERWVCATPHYLASRPPVHRPEDLLQHNCLTYIENLAQVQWRFKDASGSILELPVQGNLRSTSGPALHIAMMNGLGVGLMHDWAVHEEIASGQLVRLLPQHQVSFTAFENAVYAVYSSSRHLPMKARAFIDFLARHFQRIKAP